MANQKTEQLSAAGVKSAPAGRHIDRHGLMLVVQRSGSRSWIQRIHIQGKRVDIGLGGYPLVKLAEARDAPTRTGSATGEPGRDSGIPGTGIPSGRIRADVEPVGEPNDAGSSCLSPGCKQADSRADSIRGRYCLISWLTRGGRGAVRSIGSQRAGRSCCVHDWRRVISRVPGESAGSARCERFCLFDREGKRHETHHS